MLQSCRYPVGLCCRAAGIRSAYVAELQVSPVRPAGSGRGTRRFFHWLCWSSWIRCVPVSVCLLLCVSVLILLSVLVVMVLYNVALYSKCLKQLLLLCDVAFYSKCLKQLLLLCNVAFYSKCLKRLLLLCNVAFHSKCLIKATVAIMQCCILL